jgi:hypothetical protein
MVDSSNIDRIYHFNLNLSIKKHKAPTDVLLAALDATTILGVGN